MKSLHQQPRGCLHQGLAGAGSALGTGRFERSVSETLAIGNITDGIVARDRPAFRVNK